MTTKRFEPYVYDLYPASIWYKVKKYVNRNGWCRLDYKDYPELKKEFNSHKPYWWRPIKEEE
jgi:hypothetical protein